MNGVGRGVGLASLLLDETDCVLQNETLEEVPQFALPLRRIGLQDHVGEVLSDLVEALAVVLVP